MKIKHVRMYPQSLVAVATVSTKNRVLKVGPLGCPSFWTPFASPLHCSASGKKQDLRFGSRVLHLTKNTFPESCIKWTPQSTTIDQNPKPKFCHLYVSKKKIQLCTKCISSHLQVTSAPSSLKRLSHTLIHTLKPHTN